MSDFTIGKLFECVNNRVKIYKEIAKIEKRLIELNVEDVELWKYFDNLCNIKLESQEKGM